MSSNANFLSPSVIKKYVKSNNRSYLISLLVVLVGMILGVYLNLGGLIDDIIFSATDVSLSEIIVGEISGVSLFFKNFGVLLISSLIIFLLFTNNFTKLLAFVYLGYQGLLLGATITTVIAESGIAGILNSLVIIIPINAMNFFVLISVLVVCSKCLNLRKSQHLSFFHAIKIFFTKFLVCMIGAVVCSLIYGFIYPILLKTMIVVSS